MKLLIKDGRVVDPANDLDDIRDILIENGKISKVAQDIPVNSSQVINAKGKVVLPGLVDMHVHFREPGREDKETVSTGTAAALKAGVTSVLMMPNTYPAIDSLQAVKQLKEIIKLNAKVNVFICAAITLGRQGERLVDIAAVKNEGVLAISDDGSSVDNAALMLDAFQKAKESGLLVVCHSEDKALSAKGVVNFGLTSTRLGLRGISNASEYKRVERDIELARKADSAVHIAHVSCRESVDLIAGAKRAGARITCETAPHYFALDEAAVLGYDTNAKINPPLRSKADVLAIREGLKSGVIDAIASDHAPHTENEKAIEFERAEFGTIGLETELSVAITELVLTGMLDWRGLARRMSLDPARILGVDKGTLGIGKDADIAIIDPQKEWTPEKNSFVSKSKNSAFIGRKLKGMVEYTVCAGKVAYEL